MRYIEKLINFLKYVMLSKALFFSLVKNDFKQQYLGSYFGLIWSFLQPIFMISIMWFVFQVGFKVQPINDIPFILWLMCGMVPWYFFSDSISQATNSIIANSYLVKKIVFRVSLLPLVKIISVLYIHIFFIFVIMGMFIFYGYTPSLYWLQLPYYTICLIMLVIGISLTTSAINVFFRDISQIINVFLQFGFWGTPIFWKLDTIPEKYHSLVELNPMYYIIDGYRNVFINQVWFWEAYQSEAYFIVMVLIFFVLGITVFKKLRPNFADVL